MGQTSISNQTQTRSKFPSMWRVIMHNDDYTPFTFVIQLLQLVFNMSPEEAESKALEVHERGKANVGLFTKEVAYTKTSVVIATAEKYGFPLLATPEEA